MLNPELVTKSDENLWFSFLPFLLLFLVGDFSVLVSETGHQNVQMCEL